MESLAEARQRRSGLLHEPDLLVSLARVHLACADSVAARAAAEEAISVARRQGTAVAESHAHAVRALVLRETATCEADLSEARAAVTAGEKLATDTGALTYAAFLAEERARLEPDPAALLVGLKLAADAYTAIGAAGHARRLRDELASRDDIGRVRHPVRHGTCRLSVPADIVGACPLPLPNPRRDPMSS